MYQVILFIAGLGVVDHAASTLARPGSTKSASLASGS